MLNVPVCSVENTETRELTDLLVVAIMINERIKWLRNHKPRHSPPTEVHQLYEPASSVFFAPHGPVYSPLHWQPIEETDNIYMYELYTKYMFSMFSFLEVKMWYLICCIRTTHTQMDRRHSDVVQQRYKRSAMLMTRDHCQLEKTCGKPHGPC